MVECSLVPVFCFELPSDVDVLDAVLRVPKWCSVVLLPWSPLTWQSMHRASISASKALPNVTVDRCGRRIGKKKNV